MKNRKTFDEHWEEISENFNFVTVKKTMDFLDWVWGGKSGLKVPSIEIIIKEAKRLCEDAYNDGHGHATGGFYAKYYKKHNILELQFQLSSWASEND